MTTDQIEAAADRGDLGAGDFNAKMVLRHNVVQMFMEDVGRVGWRRKTYTFNTVIGTKEYAMPTDFHEAQGVYLPTDYDNSLKYIGEDPDLLARAESNVTNSTPTGYYIEQGSTSPNSWQTLKFQAPAVAVLAIRVVYYRYVRFADDSTNVDMAGFIPAPYHWGLVEGLRAELYLDRFGQGDPRYAAAIGSYEKWISRAGGKRELAARNYAVYAR